MSANVSSTVALQKSELRKKAKLIRASMGEESLKEISEKICQRVVSLEEFSNADAVFCYASTQNEICVDEISKSALALGKTLAFPRCKKDGAMDFFSVKAMWELTPGMLGILEPSENCPLVSPFDFENSICILPALSFDKRGYRIGYGKGYYDRYLALHPDSLYLVGVCARALLFDSLAHDHYDIPANAVVNEMEVLRIEKL